MRATSDVRWACPPSSIATSQESGRLHRPDAPRRLDPLDQFDHRRLAPANAAPEPLDQTPQLEIAPMNSCQIVDRQRGFPATL